MQMTMNNTTTSVCLGYRKPNGYPRVELGHFSTISHWEKNNMVFSWNCVDKWRMKHEGYIFWQCSCLKLKKKFPAVSAMDLSDLQGTGHKILFHKNNRFSLLLFYCQGNNRWFVCTPVPLNELKHQSSLFDASDFTHIHMPAHLQLLWCV